MSFEVLSGGLAFEDARGSGEEAQLVSAGSDFLGGNQGPHLAGVAVLRLHQFIAVGLNGVRELEQHQLPLSRGDVLPGLEGLLGRSHGSVNVFLGGDGRVGHNVTVGGVDDVQRAGAGRRNERPVDEVLQGLDHGVQPLSWGPSAQGGWI
ncbi:hypothetical protein QFZ70_000883 [Arthrobacter sp. V1I9]|nr:hypothetical protein [Arthrobacter sp. V1I9]